MNPGYGSSRRGSHPGLTARRLDRSTTSLYSSLNPHCDPGTTKITHGAQIAAAVSPQQEEEHMRSMTKFLVAGAFVIGFGLGSALDVGHGIVGAQAPHKPVMMQRVYTGADGLSHVESIELNAQSVLEKVMGARVNVSQPGTFSDYHVGPERRYIFNLTGGGQLQVAEGKVDLPAGSIEYIDDLTGKGHTTANVGKEPRLSIALRFEDQKQIIGAIGKK
jgi:hypothetical protein